MDCIFMSFSIAVLQIVFSLEVTSGSLGQNLKQILRGLNDDNPAALLNVTNEEKSVEQLQGPNVESVELLNEPNGNNSKEVLQATELIADALTISDENSQPAAVKDTNKYVELDMPDNDTVIAKLVDNDSTESNQDLDDSESNEELPPKNDKEDVIKNGDKLISHSYLDVDKAHADTSDKSSSLSSEQEDKRYIEELKRGNHAESYGTNPHYYQPDMYPELGRRFASHNSYKEDEEINLVNKDVKQTNLEPKLASPDLVLAVAKESAIINSKRPKNPSEYLIEKKSLRSGNYWNAIWKEDIKPSVLRSNQRKPLGVIPAKINPGSNLYDLVTKLKQISPRLLYVINKKIEY